MKPEIRCSELDRILTCNGSRRMNTLVSRRAGDEGAAGTRIHAHIANALVGKLQTIFLSNRFDQWVADYCIHEVMHNVPSDWSLECEGEYAYHFEQFILTGHPDAIGINPEVTEAIGWDYKTGSVSVDPAEMNEQVLGYIALLLRAYPSLRKVTFKIVQPRNDEDEGFERVSQVVITFTDQANVDAFVEGFELRVNEAIANDLEVNSGRKQCRYCDAVLQCPAIHLEIEEMKAKLTPEVLARIAQTPDDALLADMVVAGRTVAAASEQAERILHARLDVQPSVKSPNVTITRVEQGGRYTTDKPQEVFAALKTLLPERVVAGVVSYPTGKIKEAIAEHLKIPKTGKSGNTALTVFDAKFSHLFEQGKKRVLIFS